ncbi:hypothetical protein EUX98_g1560 [Antrodiella citrinella]|uniref:GH16 domain-containing protein n=1 Tax=Antrodiella citrinella TaxID=2447956 RepID=A0A4S4N467_9APHY|nr:hypothetical protein EUX98_g1560 [Antrodiella citrinella]
MPEPVCQNANFTFPDLSRVLSNGTYFGGNVSAYDWTVDKGNVINTNSSGGELAMLLTETNGGTLMSSTRYVHYGQITARVKTGRWAGVVTAFITMSDIKDEIDWEFPGANTTAGQSNYFWQGLVAEPTNGETTGGLTDTFSNYHDYTIDWKPDSLTWSIDGTAVRTLQASDTKGPDGVVRYPNTPSRIQFSIWPAGINSSAAGTVAWAGGMINWQDPDYVAAGHFYALVQSINITCEDPVPPAAGVTSYVYSTNASAFTPQINFSNATTINAAGSLMELGGVWGIRSTVAFVVFLGIFGVLF